MTIRILFGWIILVYACVSGAAEITLKDGSHFQGDVLGLSNGVYVIRSDILGTINIPQQRVRAISENSAPLSAGNSGPDSAQQIRQFQNRIQNNQGMLQGLQALQSSPDVARVLNNKQLLQAAQANDLNYLMKDPDFQRLMENPEIQQMLLQLR